jgi:calcium/calmodulin-dependent protein kinase I
LQRATWHVPLEQVAIAEGGAAAVTNPSALIHEHHHQHLLHVANMKTKRGRSPAPSSSGEKNGKSGADEITKEVALKMIPKKKVKGNEESVWGEMEVLKGLDHPNVVRRFSL